MLYRGRRLRVEVRAEEATYAAAAKEALKDARPQKHNAFKIGLARNTIVRALSVVGEMK